MLAHPLVAGPCTSDVAPRDVYEIVPGKMLNRFLHGPRARPHRLGEIVEVSALLDVHGLEHFGLGVC